MWSCLSVAFEGAEQTEQCQSVSVWECYEETPDLLQLSYLSVFAPFDLSDTLSCQIALTLVAEQSHVGTARGRDAGVSI